jgi:hypothetical protein
MSRLRVPPGYAAKVPDLRKHALLIVVILLPVAGAVTLLESRSRGSLNPLPLF